MAPGECERTHAHAQTAPAPLDSPLPVPLSPCSEAELAVAVLEKRFYDAIGAGRVSAVERIDNCCVLAAVGQGMVNHKGVAATMFGALAKASINIKAVAQVGAYAFRRGAGGGRGC